MDMLGVGSTSLMHHAAAGLAPAASAAAALTDLSGLEGLVNNGAAAAAAAVDPHSHHHHHHHLSAAAATTHHHLHAAATGHHPHMPHPHHFTAAAAAHHHHHHHSHHPHVPALQHHPPNQPLPPHRPFTPPGALSSHQLHSTAIDSTGGGGGGTVLPNNSYSPNSTSHLPTSTVKIKSGEQREQRKQTFRRYNQKRNHGACGGGFISFSYAICIVPQRGRGKQTHPIWHPLSEAEGYCFFGERGGRRK